MDKSERELMALSGEQVGDLFPATPGAECIANLDGKHNHIRDADTRIKMPGTNFKRSSYQRKLGGKEYEYFMGRCACGDKEKMEVAL